MVRSSGVTDGEGYLSSRGKMSVGIRISIEKRDTRLL